MIGSLVENRTRPTDGGFRRGAVRAVSDRAHHYGGGTFMLLVEVVDTCELEEWRAVECTVVHLPPPKLPRPAPTSVPGPGVRRGP